MDTLRPTVLQPRALLPGAAVAVRPEPPTHWQRSASAQRQSIVVKASRRVACAGRVRRRAEKDNISVQVAGWYARRAYQNT
eukprot:481091-Pleurochrysis_carterae.AAC.1